MPVIIRRVRVPGYYYKKGRRRFHVKGHYKYVKTRVASAKKPKKKRKVRRKRK